MEKDRDTVEKNQGWSQFDETRALIIASLPRHGPLPLHNRATRTVSVSVCPSYHAENSTSTQEATEDTPHEKCRKQETKVGAKTQTDADVSLTLISSNRRINQKERPAEGGGRRVRFCVDKDSKTPPMHARKCSKFLRENLRIFQ